jgi:hypothetical protein
MSLIFRKRQVKHLGYRCLGPTITPGKIRAYQRDLAHDRGFVRSKRRLALLGNGRRLDILYLLTREPELCVCDMADVLQTTVSSTVAAQSLSRRRCRQARRTSSAPETWPASPSG